MRYSVQLPTDRVDAGSEFVSAAAIGEMARAIEDAGFDACYVTEHPFPSDAWLASGGHHALDPFVALSAATMATDRLLLHTHVVVPAYRNPFLLAKSIASLDVLSGGRVIAGVAAGYLEPEYRALGADFARRNELIDEALVAMKAAWSGESVRFVGRHFEATGNTMRPRPVQNPHPPIWVGGNSRTAIRRAAVHGQGWSPFPVAARLRRHARTAAIENLDDLAQRIRYLNECAERESRNTRLDINFVPFGRQMSGDQMSGHKKSGRQINANESPGPRQLIDQIGALEQCGVNWVSIAAPGGSRAAVLEGIHEFGEDVIRALRS